LYNPVSKNAGGRFGASAWFGGRLAQHFGGFFSNLAERFLYKQPSKNEGITVESFLYQVAKKFDLLLKI
jgi:hypothetical protein